MNKASRALLQLFMSYRFQQRVRQQTRFGGSNETHDRPEILVLKNQADGFCFAINHGKFAALFMLPYVGQNRPLTLRRRTADSLVTNLVIPGV